MSIIQFSNSRNLLASDAPLTMTSREIATLTGKEHKHVLRDIRVMLSDLELGESNFGLTYLDAQNRQQTEYALDESLSVTLVSGYDAKMRFAIVKRWKELEGGLVVTPVKPPTQAQMFVQAGQVMLQLENRCEAIEESALALSNHVDEQNENLSARLDSVEQTTTWKVCPASAESIMRIRDRINIRHGLSSVVVDEVMRQSVYSPKPAGMVLNSNEFAGNSHYAVFWKKDVTKVFEMFMKEVKKETQARFSHPLIEGKFKAFV